MDIELNVNGKIWGLQVEDRRLLADVLRQDLGLYGVHLGCEHGVCGACTVLIDGRAVRSCLMLAVQGEGRQITTIEGLAKGDEMHPVQEAFMETHALQCGFCTPAFVLAVADFLDRHSKPGCDLALDEGTIREELSGNICRCTGYVNIVAAVRRAAEKVSS